MKQTTTISEIEKTAEEAPLSALPCSAPCPKCGSADINRQYRQKGERYETPYRHPRRNNVFVGEDHIDGRAKKECIQHHCRCCQYRWETDILSQNVKRSDDING